jgi:diguanylate cyclase (GGDEF)-like protein
MSSSAAVSLLPNDSPAEARTSQPRLLIVDDVADNRIILARRFQRRQFDIAEVDCGRAALDIIERDSFDVVLLDIMMPDMSGVEVLKKIRQQYSQTKLPVIMVTANSRTEDVVEALEAGANDYVTKPVDFAVALARVNTQIERKRASEALEAKNKELQHANLSLEGRISERTQRLSEATEKLQDEITQRQRSEEQSHFLAYHDPLTGLANRILFREDLERALLVARLERSPLAVLFVDLDGFKGVNDTLGHSVGDALLKTIGKQLSDAFAATARVARLGGDEFAVLLTTGEQPRAGLALADEIVKLLSAPRHVDNHLIQISASVGVSVSERGVENPDYLLKSADLAMYRAKAEGRSAFKLFDPEMDAAAQARRHLETDLRNAIIRGEFQAYYQPLVDVKTRRISCFETLARWRHPTRGLVSPVEFIPVAEDTGLIVRIGEWILREACTAAMTWPPHVRVAVNVSPVEFQKGDVVKAVQDALAISGLAPPRLEVEITESVLLERTTKNVTTLARLREIGVRVSLDDFGTGFSSLSYLRSYPFDKIKVDRSFVSDLSKDDRSRMIISAITGLGARFGMSTTAEGVETEEQFEWLRNEGCDEVQGWLFSKAVPAAEVPALLAKIGAKQDDAAK